MAGVQKGREGAGIWGAQEEVSRPSSLPRPFRTPAAQAKLADLIICERRLEEIPAFGLPGFKPSPLRYGSCALTSYALTILVIIIEFKLHVHGKQQTPDSSWEFLKIENEQIKTAQNNSNG